MKMPVIEMVPLTEIRMRGNARTVFDAMELEELAASIRDSDGALQLPVGHRAGDGMVELICGERRLRAQSLLREREGRRWEAMAVRMMEEPTEADFLKWSLAENVQRVNLRPSETGGWLARMMALEDGLTGRGLWTLSSLAEEIGKPERWVSSVLAAIRAPEGVVRAMDEGRCSPEVAGLIGGLPERMREAAAREVVLGPLGPMHRDAARQWIGERYRRDLRQGDFDVAVEDYGPGLPACSRCEWWGGNREDVAGLSRSTTCLNPGCFAEKQRAHAEREAARSGGSVRWLSPEEGEGMFEGHSGQLAVDCGYVDLAGKPEAGLLVDGNLNRDGVPTWRKILAEEGLAPVAVMDGRGRRRDLVEAEAAIRAAVGGRYGSLFRPGAGEGLLSQEEKALKRAVDGAVEREGRAVAVEGMRGWLEGWSKGDLGPGGLLDLVEVAVGSLCKPDDVAALCEVLEPEGRDRTGRRLVELAGTMLDGEGLAGLLGLVLVVRVVRYRGFEPMVEDGPLGRLCEGLGFDAAEWHRVWKRRRGAAERRAREEGERSAQEALEREDAKRRAVRG